MGDKLAVQWHLQQKDRVSKYKPRRPEISGDHGCAGACSIPVPTPPGREGFTSITHVSSSWLVLMAVVTIGYIGLTRRAK